MLAYHTRTTLVESCVLLVKDFNGWLSISWRQWFQATVT